MSISGQSLAGCRVLVVEDEYLLAMELACFLRSNGAEIIGPVGRLQQAEAKVFAGGFDVAALDISLCDEMICGIADELKRQDIPFLFITGYSAEAVPVAFADVPLLNKPCDDATLVEIIQGLCPLLRPILKIG